ncbi:hypothetical protein GE107_04325 [Cohnella sp. CFH 77786]|uniref:glutathione ABC transporter substrate-binding protein n=1 Tax=Cohnella sp. CFH 77786 TaxID=2662265 RepID=UPI001C610C85|nr:glutathione ABC transporter substrate-binding protein [Cohnella sp. CFH 77786]MBW5445289.1 hypothetical protein [Cohnella sp. CFH 77786]
MKTARTLKMVKTVATVIFTLMVAVACTSQNGSSDDSASSASNAPSASTKAASSEQAERGDLVVAMGAEPVKLDPQDASDGVSNNANELLYDKLVTLDREGKIVPQLAESWTFSEDRKKITFKLRDNAKFQDGTPVNAEAVKVTFDRVLNKENKLNRYSLFGAFIDKVNVDGEYQVSFDLKFPFGPALMTFAHTNAGIHSPKNLQEKGSDVGKSPVGSGPFKLKEWVPGDKVVFEAFDDYWGGKPKLKTITFKTVPESSARTIMLETGEADVALPISITDIDRLRENQDLTVNIEPSSRNLYFALNTTRPPFNDPKVRQAVNYAVDKETIVRKIMGNNAIVAEAAIGHDTWGFTPVGAYPYDPEKAKQLLAEAGVKEGTTIKLWTADGRYLMDRQIAEFVQANLQAVGFKVEFQKRDFGSYTDGLREKDADFNLSVNAWGNSTNDADWGLRPVLGTDGSSNYSKFSSPKLDELLEQGMKEVDEAKRKQIYAEALQLVKDDAPWIFVLDYSQTTGVRKNVENVYSWANERLILREASKK